MERMTKPLSEGEYFVEKQWVAEVAEGFTGEAVKRLARFENVYIMLLARQEEIAEKLEQLRREDKKNSVKFKELLGEKLMNTNAITLFKTYVED